MRYLEAAVLALTLAASVAAAREPVVAFSDPPDDDFGAGGLVYPQRRDYLKGDLDLRHFQIERDAEGFWFEAEFKNTIRDPYLAFSGVGPSPESMASTARRGFYTFNIDIYVDIDRKPGSGNQFTLPGRKVRIDPAYAWERAVILTPRPEAIRRELLDVLSRQFPDRSKAEAAASIDQSMFFPKRVRVRGKSISFFVPKEFLGGSDGSDWAITVLVTGAKPFTSLNLSLLPSAKTPLEELELGVMQPTLGRPEDTFGYDASVAPSPIVDILQPTVLHQTALLTGKRPLTGMSWGPRGANEMASAPKAVPVPAGVSPSKAEAEDSFFSNPLGSVKRLLRSEPERPARAGPAAPVETFLDPSAPAAAGAAAGGPTAPAASVAPAASFTERLQTLQKLYDQKLIDETEYKAQRQRILNQL